MIAVLRMKPERSSLPAPIAMCVRRVSRRGRNAIISRQQRKQGQRQAPTAIEGRMRGRMARKKCRDLVLIRKHGEIGSIGREGTDVTATRQSDNYINS